MSFYFSNHLKSRLILFLRSQRILRRRRPKQDKIFLRSTLVFFRLHISNHQKPSGAKFIKAQFADSGHPGH
jgi:hypothetical protein